MTEKKIRCRDCGDKYPERDFETTHDGKKVKLAACIRCVSSAQTSERHARKARAKLWYGRDRA